MYCSENAGSLESQPERLAHGAVRPVGADEIAGAHRLLFAVAVKRRGDAVGVLLEGGHLDTAFDLHAVHGELLAQDPLGDVLRDRDEPERDVGGRAELDQGDLLPVDVDELAEQLDCCVENGVEHSHAFEHL